jgi:hypothetical protein
LVESAPVSSDAGTFLSSSATNRHKADQWPTGIWQRNLVAPACFFAWDYFSRLKTGNDSRTFSSVVQSSVSVNTTINKKQ